VLQGTWDLRDMTREPSIGFRLYVLFVLVAWVAAIIKLVRIWRPAPPFRLSRQLDSPQYLRTLQTTSIGLQQWIGFTFLLWGLLACVSASSTCFRLYSEKVNTAIEILSATTNCVAALNMALFTVAFFYLMRSHVVKRIESLRR
jgi:hypothetical protein